MQEAIWTRLFGLIVPSSWVNGLVIDFFNFAA
jgi:hypothetical protein